MRIATMPLLLLLCATVGRASCAEETVAELLQQNVKFTLVERRGEDVHTITGLFAGRRYHATVIVNEETYDSVEVSLSVLHEDVDHSTYTLRYDVLSDLRYFDDAGQELASSPVATTCVGEIKAEVGTTYALLQSDLISYDLRLEAAGPKAE